MKRLVLIILLLALFPLFVHSDSFIHGGGGGNDGVGYDEIEDEGTGLTKRAVVNFIGAGVACVDNGGGAKTDCTIAGAGTGDILAVGTCTIGSCAIEGGNDMFPFIYEGTANLFETTFSVTDPTADRAIVFPNLGGTVSLFGASVDLTTEVTGTLPIGNGGTGATALDDILGTANEISVGAGANTIIGGAVTLSLPTVLTLSTKELQGLTLFIAEGAVADGFETIFNITEPTTPDKTITFPDATGEVSLLGQTIADAELVSNYSGIGACAANNAATTLNDDAAPTCSEFSALGQTISFISPVEVLDECAGLQAIRRNTGDTAFECFTPSAASNSFGTIGTAIADSAADTLTITDTLSIDLITTNAPEDLSAAFDYTSTLAGNPALNLDEAIFSSDGTGGGILFEGSVADGFEGLLLWNITASDKTLTLPNATDNLLGRDTTDTLTNKTLAVASNPITSTINRCARFDGSGNLAPHSADCASGSGDISTVGTCVTGDCAIEGGNDMFPFIYEGTANTEETTFSVTDPTVDRAISFPDAGGEVSLLGQTISLTAEVTGTLPIANGGTNATVLDDIVGTANEITVAAGTGTVIGGDATLSLPTLLTLSTKELQGATLFLAEGATANLFEATFSQFDITADRTYTFPDATGEVSLLAQTISGSEMVNDTVTVTQLAATLTFGATDFLDLSGIDSSTLTEGLKLPQHATLCATGFSEGQVCWEADANVLHIGDGAAFADIYPGLRAASTTDGGGATSLEAGALDALTEIASALCGTNEILEDQGASWGCIATPSGGSEWTDGGTFLRPNTDGDGVRIRSSTDATDYGEITYSGTTFKIDSVQNTTSAGILLFAQAGGTAFTIDGNQTSISFNRKIQPQNNSFKDLGGTGGERWGDLRARNADFEPQASTDGIFIKSVASYTADYIEIQDSTAAVLFKILSSGNVFMGDDSLFQRDVNATITASTTQTQGNGALTAEVNEIATVANANDTVTLPTAVAGLKIVVINNGANTLQIFPASGDNLGTGVDTSTTLEPNVVVAYVTYDGTNWANTSQLSRFHAEMQDEDNTDAFGMSAALNFEVYHTNGLVVGDTSGWTFDAGGGGTSFPIASIADGGAGEIAVTTTGSHLLAVGDIISQANLTDAAYEGVFVVNTITSATIYEVTATFTATGTGTMNQAAVLIASTGSAADYSIMWSASATSATNNETFDFKLFNKATAITGSEARTKFGTAADFQTVSGVAIVKVANGDKISFALENQDTAGDITIRYLTLILTRL